VQPTWNRHECNWFNRYPQSLRDCG